MGSWSQQRSLLKVVVLGKALAAALVCEVVRGKVFSFPVNDRTSAGRKGELSGFREAPGSSQSCSPTQGLSLLPESELWVAHVVATAIGWGMLGLFLRRGIPDHLEGLRHPQPLSCLILQGNVNLDGI